MRELTIFKMPIKSYNINYNMIKRDIIRQDIVLQITLRASTLGSYSPRQNFDSFKHYDEQWMLLFYVARLEQNGASLVYSTDRALFMCIGLNIFRILGTANAFPPTKLVILKSIKNIAISDYIYSIEIYNTINNFARYT